MYTCTVFIIHFMSDVNVRYTSPSYFHDINLTFHYEKWPPSILRLRMPYFTIESFFCEGLLVVASCRELFVIYLPDLELSMEHCSVIRPIDRSLFGMRDSQQHSFKRCLRAHTLSGVASWMSLLPSPGIRNFHFPMQALVGQEWRWWSHCQRAGAWQSHWGVNQERWQLEAERTRASGQTHKWVFLLIFLKI